MGSHFGERLDLYYPFQGMDAEWPAAEKSAGLGLAQIG